MLDFNQAKDRYRSAIEGSVAFTGTDHAFFIAEKGKMILDLARRRFAGRKLKLLDVGCGHGFVHPMLLDAGHEVTGVEIAEEVLEMAAKTNPAACYLPYDGQVLPAPDASFDMVMVMCVVHHVPVPQWGDFLKELRRVLRPDGVIVIFEHNPINPVVNYLFHYGFGGMDKGATMIGRRKLERLLSKTGCSGIQSGYIFFTPFGSRFFRWLDRVLAWLPLGAQYMTLAGKGAKR
jgi:SAM-dependent methyltransferase